MDVTAWTATEEDVDHVGRLYRLMEAEQVGLKAVWRLADGLPEPAEAALKEALVDPEQIVVLGGIDGVPLGFAMAGSRPLLPQANGERVGVIQYIFTEAEARGVGIGEAMMRSTLAELRERGHHLFDAGVLPGHRDAKNFFEASGFAARSLTMHRDETQGETS